MVVSKRDFLIRIGQVAGAGVLYSVMQGLGHFHVAQGATQTPVIPKGQSGNKSVLILGGGIAGLSAAYELMQAGYDCRLLEASDIVGGRCRTLRRGDAVFESGADAQICKFDKGLYMNAGPARIPSAHQAVLGYCRTFGIDLEVFINNNRSALFQDDRINDGHPVESRQVHHDTAGLISELLAKAIDGHLLDEELGDIHIDRLFAFLGRFGELDYYGTYAGGGRSGYESLPGAFEKRGRLRRPLELKDLLSSDFWRWKMYFEEEFFQQATMFQPVGGMDAIVRAFADRLGDRIETRAAVTEIHNTENGVQATFNADGSEGKVVNADFCICTLPLKVLAGVTTNLSAQHKEAVRSVAYMPVVKIGYQANRRFWEEDDAIYGGISYINHPITQIWYPCSGYHSGKGIMVGAYAFHGDAVRLSAMTPKKRYETAKTAGSKLHPQIGSEVGRPISVAWHNMPLAKGAWAVWRRDQRGNEYRTLSKPDRNMYFAGEHMSWLPGWQEGAVLSAHEVVSSIHERAQTSKG
ncbi:flavin monoamine oxidase family protein [Hoeflea sp. TYP-13]|uniref:flavin monoamine oxidase family protein n=1 Tax=Hoeflea sp. TYP-13 TaxID=3230023 RepID=UPI0034C6DC41